MSGDLGATEVKTVTITNGTSLSNAALLQKYRLVGILMPATWTAAAMTFQVSVDGTNFFDLYDSSGAEVSYTVVQGHYVFTTPANWAGIRFLKVRSGTGGAAVSQGGDRIVSLIVRPLA